MIRALVPVVAAAHVVVLAGCPAIAVPRFPPDVSAALADEPMRRLETEHLIVFYPASRVAQARRFADYAERCAVVVRERAIVRNQFWAEKAVIVMPEMQLNNAFVAPPALGLEPIAVVPTHATLDFSTLFGLPPDPRYVACHELVHHVHENQIDGTWGWMSGWMGHVLSPQLGFDLWFFEGIATHYEAALQPGMGRPRWPIFTGMFAAAYAGRGIEGDDLSELGRHAPVGHHYLVGAMFVDFLVERYGERALWLVIAAQAKSTLVVTSVAGKFEGAYGRGLRALIAEFSRWSAQRFPVRPRGAGQRRVAELGSDARYARGADGTEAWVSEDVDQPARLVVRGHQGEELADERLVEVVPPRRLAIAGALLVSGLSVTRDGKEVWLTVVDLAGEAMTTRLLRWRRGDGQKLEVIASGLGPGLCVTPGGEAYFYADVDGDRWRLARYEVATRKTSIVMHVAPGMYVVAAQASADGARLAASVWNGRRFAIWVIDVATGRREQEIVGGGEGEGEGEEPVYDGAFLPDGRVMYLGVRDGRFQVVVRGSDGRETVATDAPYAALAPRAAGDGTIRFLDREGWRWEVAEVRVPEAATSTTTVASMSTAPSTTTTTTTTTSTPVVIQSDAEASKFERLFVPTMRGPTLAAMGPGNPLLGVVLAGGDRLGFQRWAMAGYAQPGKPKTTYSGSISYLNAMLAPWLVLGDASWFRWNEPLDVEDGEPEAFRQRRTREASVTIARTWRGAWAAGLSGVVTEDVDQIEGNTIRRALGGGGLALGYDAVDGTPYTGIGRELAVSAAATWYPDPLSTFAGDLVDVATTLRVAETVPATRLVATAELRGRAVFAREPIDADLIEVGGVFALAPLWQRASVDVPEAIDDLRFPPGRRFSEAVRGFEDLPRSTDRALAGHLSLRHPLIIDSGVVSTWFLPASFLRQLDLEAFGAGWVDLDPDRARAWHLAAGGAVTLRLAFFRIPLALQYQVARRFTDDEAWTQVVGLGLDL